LTAAIPPGHLGAPAHGYEDAARRRPARGG
jgi:hypothetical protein